MTIDLDLMLETVARQLNERLRKSGDASTSGHPRRLYLALDGIDELPSWKERAQALEALDRVCHLAKCLSTFRMHIILFSREDSQVETHCNAETGWKHLKIPRNATDRDVQHAMERQIANHDKMRHFSEREQTGLALRIKEKADGMYVEICESQKR